MALHNTLEGFMGELKALPKGSVQRGKFITSHMSHPPFLDALQQHPQGKSMHQHLMGYLNSPANAGPGKAVVTVKSLLVKANDVAGNPGWQSTISNKPTTSDGLEAPYGGEWNNFAGSQTLQHKYFVHNDRHLNKVQAAQSPDGKVALQYIPHTDDTMGDEESFAQDFPGKTYIPYEPPTKLGSVNNFQEAQQVGDALISHLSQGGHQSEFTHPLLQANSMPGRFGSSTEAVGKPQAPQKLMNSEKAVTILKTEGDSSVADKQEYTVDEAAEILRNDFQAKLVKYSAELEALVKRETAKSLIPSHKHNQAAAASSGTEDIAAGQANPKGTHKAEACAKCGEMHDGKDLEKCGKVTKAFRDTSKPAEPQIDSEPEPVKGERCEGCGSKGKLTQVKVGDDKPYMCSDCASVHKSDLIDSKGKTSDNHTDPKSADMPDESPKEPEKRADSSGGKITKSVGPRGMAKRAMSMSKAQIKDSSGKIHSFDDSKIKKLPGPSNGPFSDRTSHEGARNRHTGQIGKKPNMDQSAEFDKATPPMAKPPSGENMGTKVPTSAPGAKKPAAGAPVAKAGLGMAASGQREAAAMGFGAKPAPAGPAPKLPGAPAQAARSAGFQDQMADVAAANKPAAAAKPALPKPAASGPAGAKLGLASPKAAGVTQSAGPVQNAARPSKPGIFGKLFGAK